MEYTTRFTLRLPLSLEKQIRQQAELAHHSIQAEVISLLELALKKLALKQSEEAKPAPDLGIDDSQSPASE